MSPIAIEMTIVAGLCHFLPLDMRTIGKNKLTMASCTIASLSCFQCCKSWRRRTMLRESWSSCDGSRVCDHQNAIKRSMIHMQVDGAVKVHVLAVATQHKVQAFVQLHVHSAALSLFVCCRSSAADRSIHQGT